VPIVNAPNRPLFGVSLRRLRPGTSPRREPHGGARSAAGRNEVFEGKAIMPIEAKWNSGAGQAWRHGAPGGCPL